MSSELFSASAMAFRIVSSRTRSATTFSDSEDGARSAARCPSGRDRLALVVSRCLAAGGDVSTLEKHFSQLERALFPRNAVRDAALVAEPVEVVQVPLEVPQEGV